MEWNEKDCQHPLVRNATVWQYIYNFPRISEEFGVFLFANSIHQIKFIWHSSSKNITEDIAMAIEKGKDFATTLVLTLFTNSLPEAEELSNMLINKYKPTNNFTENQDSVVELAHILNI